MMLWLAAVVYAGCPDEVVINEEIQALEEELAALQIQTDMLRAQRVAVEGRPIPWPEGIEARDHEAHAAALLGELTASSPHPVEVVGMECLEWPCIAVLAGVGTDQVDENGRQMNGIRFVDNELSAINTHSGVMHEGLSLDKDDPIVSAIAYLGDRPWKDGEYERIAYRIERLQEVEAERFTQVSAELRGD